MKTDLRSLKKEFGKLTDIDFLKKEISRIAGEIATETKREVKKIDSAISPAARARLERLEKSFQDLMKKLTQLQKQVDTNLDKFIHLVRDKRAATAKTTSKKAAGKKAPAKKKAAGAKKKKAATKK